MEMENINYAIRYLKEFHRGVEINNHNIRAVQGFPSYKIWLKEQLEKEGKYTEPELKRNPQFEPVFTYRERQYEMAKQEWLTHISTDFKAF